MEVILTDFTAVLSTTAMPISTAISAGTLLTVEAIAVCVVLPLPDAGLVSEAILVLARAPSADIGLAERRAVIPPGAGPASAVAEAASTAAVLRAAGAADTVAGTEPFTR